jgi:hypothetical protein
VNSSILTTLDLTSFERLIFLSKKFSRYFGGEVVWQEKKYVIAAPVSKS